MIHRKSSYHQPGYDIKIRDSMFHHYEMPIQKQLKLKKLDTGHHHHHHLTLLLSPKTAVGCKGGQAENSSGPALATTLHEGNSLSLCQQLPARCDKNGVKSEHM